MAGFESRIIAGRSPTGQPRAVEITAAGELRVSDVAGGATQYQEDAPSTSGDLGMMALAIRNDAGGTLVNANGDYAPLQVNAAGQLIIAGGAGGTSMADDAPFAPGATQITPIGAMLDDIAPDLVNEGDAGIPRMSANRNLYVRIRDNAGNERGLNVDAAGAIAVTDGGGSLTVDNAALAVLGGGVEAGALRVTIANNSTGLVSVDDNGGSLTVDGGVTADIRDGAGVALTSTLVGADQALDVNIVAGAGAGGTSMVDDAAFTVETTAFTPIGGTLDDVAPDSIGEGDAGVVRMSANRNIYVRIRDDQGNERGLRVDANGAIAVTNTVLSVVGGGAEATAQRVTIANDSTGVLSVDDNGGSLTVDGAGTSMIDDAAFTPATTPITPTGAMFDDAAPDSVDEGDAGIVRMSANRNLYTTIRDAAGNERGLNVDANNRIGVTNPVLSVVGGGAEATAQRVTIANDSTGTLTVDGAGTSMVDDAAFTPATTRVTPIAAFADEAAPDSVDEGDAGVVRMSLNRALHVILRDAAGNERGLNIAADNTIGINDAGGSLTVDNAVLSVVGGGTEAAAQRVTIANDSTGVLSVDDNAGSLTVDQATHDNLQCNANMQVGDADVANGNPVPVSDAGGTLTVDNAVLSVVGGGTEAAAQRVTIANDSTGLVSVDDGGAALSVDDNGGSLTVDNAILSVVGGGTEAAAQRVTIANDSTGVLTVDDGGSSLTVDGAGTSMVDDAAFTPGTTPITPIGATFDDAAPDSVDEGDAGIVRMSANRNLYTTLRDAAGNERGLNVDAAGAIAVTNGALAVVGGGAEATALRVTIANDSTGLVSVDDNGGSLTVDNPVLSVVGGGTEAAAQRVTIANDSTGVLSVDDAGGTLTVDNTVLSVVGGGTEAAAQRVTIANDSTGLVSVDDGGGALTVDGTVTASNTAGDVAHDAVDSGNPVKVGARAIETDGTDPGEVAEADRTDLKADMNGRLLVNTGHPNAWKTNNNYGAAQTDTALKAAPGANLSLYITAVILSTEEAQNIEIVSDTGGGPSTTELGPFYFADNGGMVAMTFEPAIRIAANTDVGVTSSGAVNHTITLNGYTAP